MKLKIIILTYLLLSGGMVTSFAQETARERIDRRQARETTGNTSDLSVRAEQMNRRQETNLNDEAKWSRVIYRYLDLSKEANAPLYFPVTPSEGRMNLFSMIFKLLQDNSIKAYEYLDGREVFTDEYVVDFKEFLDRFGIFHETENGKIVVNDVDIPGNEVQGYFVKEAYYFNTGTSTFGVKPVAICPVIQRQGDYDANTTRYPLFWIPYDEIRPYAMRMPIMTSSLNNTMSGTIDDFFRKRTYDGEIFKAMNLRNLAISQYTSTPEEMKAEQEKIERELKDFEVHLWKQENVIPSAKPKEKRLIFRRSGNSSSSSSSVSMRDRRL